MNQNTNNSFTSAPQGGDFSDIIIPNAYAAKPKGKNLKKYIVLGLVGLLFIFLLSFLFKKTVIDSKNIITIATDMKEYGLNEKSIIRNYEDKTFERKHKTTADKTKELDRCTAVVQAMEYGLNEKTIIKQVRDHYNTIHPTQKPVRLLERLLALVIPKDKPRNEVVVADFFAGSMSCMEAVHNMGMKGIATEIDQEYFQAGKQRIESLQPKLIE